MFYGVVLSFDVITHAIVLTNNTVRIEQVRKQLDVSFDAEYRVWCEKT